MPIGTGIVYNAGDLILSQVSGSGTAFLETKIAAATSSIVYFDSTARINSASLSSLTIGTASYVSGSTSIITNLTASNISASGNISASLFVGSHTGSTFGTSSWASNAVSASYAITSSVATNETLGTVTGRGASTGTQITVATATAGTMFTGRKAGSSYSDTVSGATFKSITDNSQSFATSYAFAAYYSGSSGFNSFYVSSNGDGYFSGSVGIGTSSPAYKLDVSGSSRFGFTPTNTHQFTGSVSFTDGLFLTNLTASNISASGTLSASNVWFNNSMVYTETMTTGSLTTPDITFTNTATTGSDVMMRIDTTVSTGSSIALQINASGSQASYAISASNGIIAGTNYIATNITASNISASGTGYFNNLGVGTTVITEKINVAGNILLSNGSNRFVRIGSSTNYNYDLQTTGNDFQIIEAGTTPRLTIQYPNGNVGIGTTVPAYLLDVSGSSRHGYRAADTHQFTGSVNISGSVTAISFTGSLSGSVSNALTASYLTPANSYTITNLTASNISASGYVSASRFWGTTATFTNISSSGPVVVSGSNAYIQLLPVGAISIPTNLSASYIYVSGSTNDLYFTQYQGPFTNTTRLRWLESNMYTGILFGGQISSTPGSTTFNVKSGSGLIVSMNATTGSDPYPTIKQLSWPDYNNQPITNSGSAKITYVGLDNTGQIVQQTNVWGSTDINQWDEEINLGVVLHLSGSVSTGVFNSPQISYGYPQKTDDFTRAFGPLKISGHTLQASGSGLSIQKTGGTAFREGANYYINPNHPSTVTENAITASKIYRYYLSGSTPIIDTGVGNAGYTTLDITKYNNNGVLTDLQGSFNNQFTLQRVFWIPNSPTNAFIVYYGNAVYSTLLDAINAVGTEAFTEAPNTALNAIELATIVIEGDSTNLTTTNKCTIVQSGLFRNVGGVGSGGTTPVVTSLDSLSDVAIAGPSQGDLLIYGNGTQWVNSKTLVGAYKLTGSLSTNDGVSVISLSASVVSASSLIVNNITSSGPLIYDNAVLLDYGSVSTPVVSTNYVVLQNLTGSYNSAFFDYFASSGSNFRAGTVIAGWSGSNVNYTEYATTDVGNTNQLSMSVDLNGSFVRLLTRVSTTINWNIKSAGRYL